MICPPCRRLHGDDTPRCECGFAFVAAPEEMDGWFGAVRQILGNVAAPGGHLLVAHYRCRSEKTSQGWLDEELKAWGFAVESVTRGFNGDGRELTRVAGIAKR